MTLTQIRHSGATVELKPDGGIGVRGASPAIIDAIKQNRASIIATLKREQTSGIDYHDSKLYWSLHLLHDSWYYLPPSSERDNALLLIRRWDSAITDNFAQGVQMVIEEQPMLELLADSVTLEGRDLHRTLSRMIDDKVTAAAAPAARTALVQARTVNRSALDEPVALAPAKDESSPKQYGLMDEPQVTTGRRVANAL